MKITINEDNNIQLEEVYLPVVLVTDKGEKVSFTMRDGGFELNHNGTMYELKDGELREVERPQEEREEGEVAEVSACYGCGTCRHVGVSTWKEPCWSCGNYSNWQPTQM